MGDTSTGQEMAVVAEQQKETPPVSLSTETVTTSESDCSTDAAPSATPATDGVTTASEEQEKEVLLDQVQETPCMLTATETTAPETAVVVAVTDRVRTFKIFVKNLSRDTSAEELKALFAAFGRVAECEIFQTKTMAFVHMEDEVAGKVAIDTLNQRVVNGNTISVEHSLQKYQGPSIPTTRLRVSNVPGSMTARDLRSLFIKFGIVVAAEITNGEGLVSIEAVADIGAALEEVNGFIYDNCTLEVSKILNTEINYMPKPRKPDLVPNSHSSYSPAGPSSPSRPRFSHGGRGRGQPRHPMPMRPRFQNNFYQRAPCIPDNPEGRVLRDPLSRPPPPPRSFRPPPTRVPFLPPIPRHPESFHQGPPHGPMIPRGPMMGNRPVRPTSNASIEPLFFKRHELLGNEPIKMLPNNSNAQQQVPSSFDNDDYSHAYNFANNGPPPPTQTRPATLAITAIGARNPVLSNPCPPPRPQPVPPPRPQMQQQSYQRPQMRFPVKQNAPPDPGQPFAVPTMIAPGVFQPPKKYFQNRPNQPKSKRRKTDRPQQPVPDHLLYGHGYSKPVPDFSDYYTMPDNVVLRPFPPPAEDPNADYSDDVRMF